MRIAVDAMGGDNAPHLVVRGAADAAGPGIDITLVGHEANLKEVLASCSCRGTLHVHHCSESVRMDESPLRAVKKKKDASIRVAFDLAKRGKVDAVVSAGNSGATLAAGILTLGRLQGVERPGIASMFPGRKGRVILIDVGANVDCRPVHLLQFGLMSSAFAVACFNMENPRVGLLNIGEEGGKGNEQVRLTHDLFVKSQLNFIGNVEGRDIFTGDVDIVVCDGFVGNVALKVSEGMAEAMTERLEAEFDRTVLGKIARFIGRGRLKNFKRKMEYEEYGGALILGIDGVSVVCHGASSPRAIRNAIELAARYVENDVLGRMSDQLRLM